MPAECWDPFPSDRPECQAVSFFFRQAEDASLENLNFPRENICRYRHWRPLADNLIPLQLSYALSAPTALPCRPTHAYKASGSDVSGNLRKYLLMVPTTDIALPTGIAPAQLGLYVCPFKLCVPGILLVLTTPGSGFQSTT